MFSCRSEAFIDGIIKPEYGISSKDVSHGIPTRSLPLEWADPPEGTASYAIVFEDYDNIPDEGVCWIHWIAADIPAETTGLPKNASRTLSWLTEGKNSWHMPYAPYDRIPEELTIGYGGPAPERPHEYELTVYALDKKLGMEPGFFYNELRRAMEGHVLAQCRLKGIYDRKD
jgi:Raf kinase inhibitor-like YbhB/YbcL family protein